MRRALAFTWAAGVDLLLDAVLGTVWFGVVFGLLVTGVVLLPAFGFGFVLLGVGASLTWATGRIERLRANALLGCDVPSPQRPRTWREGWRRPFAQALEDLRGPAMWRTLLHHFCSMVLGIVVIFAGSLAIETAVGLALDSRSLLTSPFLDTLGAGASVVVSVVLLLAILPLVYFAGQFDRVVLAPLLGPLANARLREEIDTLSGARQAAVDAAAIERQRIERDLHDGAQPRLVSVAMTLGMARAKFDSDPTAARAMLERAHSDTKSAITELRQLARGIHPAVLTDRGLDAALSALASRNSVPTSVEVDLAERLSPEIEAVVYFTIAEALTNVAKYSGAATCRVVVSCVGDVLTASVLDDGRGGARIEDGGGLAGIVARVRSAGGIADLDSPIGGPTQLSVELPCVS